MTGANALEVAAKLLPHLVLMDIGLPGMDSYEVARRMRAEPNFEGVTLCALTGYTPSEGDRLRHQAGFNHHFVKPVSVIALTELLNSVGKVAR